VRALLKQSKPVRVLARDVEKTKGKFPTVSIAEGSLEDTASLVRVFHGVAGVFVLTPPLVHSADIYAENRKLVDNIISAATQVKVPKIVFLSSVGAQHPSGIGAIGKLHTLEKELQKLDTPTLSLRAAWFLENFLSQFGHGSNQLFSFINLDLSIPMIATEDIGVAAAHYLQEDWKGHRIVELSGPRNYTTVEIAHEASSFYGIPIAAVPVPAEHREVSYKKFGLSESAANSLSEMDGGFNSGHIVFEGGHETFHGKLTLTDVLKAL